MTSPLARNTDPDSSRLGAARIEQKRVTRKRQVLERLRAGGWVPSHHLTTAACGGSEGLRRLRELRADGWPIEVRFSLDGTGTEYRLQPGHLEQTLFDGEARR